MATYTAATFNFNLGTDGPYQALWGAVDTQLQGLGGWTYTSQTGDADPASTATGSNGTYPAWRVYSTTSGATTWYMRLDYGHTASGPSFKVQFGTTVNGSGTLGGQLQTQVTCTAGNTSTNQSVHIGQATGRFMLLLGLSSNTGSAIAGMSAHGSVDGSGAMNGGMEVYTLNTNQSHLSQYLPASGTVQPQQAQWPCAFGHAASQAFGGVTPLGIPQLWDTTGATNPTMACFVYATNDLTHNSTTTVSLYGSTLTYLVSDANQANGSDTNNRSGWRYD